MLRLFAILVTILLLSAPAANAQDGLSGSYLGVEDAEGARIEIRPEGEGFSGTLHDARGRSQSFLADRIGEAAQAVVDLDGGPALMQVSPTPYGAEVVLIPIEENGALDEARGRVDSFVSPDLEMQELPPGYLPPPATPNRRITGNSFVKSYRFWSPVGVRNGYLALPDRVRTIMRFFPAVQLDVIFHLCRAPQPEQALAIALRGQGVSCPQVLDAIAAAERSGSFAAYESAVQDELGSLRTSIRCAEGYPESKTTCDNAARQLSQAALSLRTAANVLAGLR